MSIRFKQIAVASDSEYGEMLYALSEDGVIYVKSRATIHQHLSRKTVEYWQQVDLPMSKPSEESDE